MTTESYLRDYRFNWEALDIIASGLSSIDGQDYLAKFESREDALNFLRGYGYDLTDPIQNAEMFGNFQEAIQFIKRYFLKEGNEKDGLDYTVPSVFLTITDVSDLLMIATNSSTFEVTEEDSLWAEIILKVMHTILHLDKDVRHQYFPTIQTQIFDRFYKYLHREDEQLYLENEDKSVRIELVDFQTKSKKTRASTIIKLLHKKDNVAEELFDRIGIRFVTNSKLDCLRVVSFLNSNHIIMANNIKPSRSQNSLVNLRQLQEKFKALVKDSRINDIGESEFIEKVESLIEESYDLSVHKDNEHSSNRYRAIHFTGRQLVKYKSPFFQEFNSIKNFLKEDSLESSLAERILELDTSSIAKDVRFFYPFEVQVTDVDSHKQNSEGDASHDEYKRSQLLSAMNRVFGNLNSYSEAKK